MPRSVRRGVCLTGGVTGLSGELTVVAAASELAMFTSRDRQRIITPSLLSSLVPDYHNYISTY